MRDLDHMELDFVYGAGSGHHRSPSPPSRGSKGSKGSRGKGSRKHKGSKKHKGSRKYC